MTTTATHDVPKMHPHALFQITFLLTAIHNRRGRVLPWSVTPEEVCDAGLGNPELVAAALGDWDWRRAIEREVGKHWGAVRLTWADGVLTVDAGTEGVGA